MEAAAVGEEDDCHGIAENAMFSQLAPMGTGAFLALISAGIKNSITADQPHELFILHINPLILLILATCIMAYLLLPGVVRWRHEAHQPSMDS